MADPRTIVLPGNGTSVAAYNLSAGVSQYIQSIVATIDTSGSGDTTPLLTISEQSGAVVADVPQDDVIPGGGDGRATWALRLAGSGGGGGGGGTTAEETFRDTTGVSVAQGVTKRLPFVSVGGSALLDLTTPTFPTIVAAGTYAFSMRVFPTALGAVTYSVSGNLQVNMGADTQPSIVQTNFTPIAGGTPSLMLPFTRTLPAGTSMFVEVAQTNAAAQTLALAGLLARIA